MGSVFGNEVIFMTNPAHTTDYDGNLYGAIKIGSQIWMAENLKSTHYSDGTAIPYVTENTEWGSLTTPGYCWYNNDSITFKDAYGALYNWYTVNTGKLCPIGWHVPADIEWTILRNFLGGEINAGGPLKEAGTAHWNDPNTGATNETGFTALPGGGRFPFTGNFGSFGQEGIWWSNTESSTDKAWEVGMYYLNNGFGRGESYKKTGISVRCLKDN